jgi:hypothetical protein
MNNFKEYFENFQKAKILKLKKGTQKSWQKPKSRARFQTTGYTPKFPLEQGVGNY